MFVILREQYHDGKHDILTFVDGMIYMCLKLIVVSSVPSYPFAAECHS